MLATGGRGGVRAVRPAPSTCKRSSTLECIYGKIKSDNRARPKHETADRLVYCHEALHLRTKMQKANYQPPVVKWDDSDSDSNVSEDEDYTI